MADPIPAIGQVEDALAAVLAAYPPLAEFAIRTDQLREVAIEADEINVFTQTYRVEQPDEHHATLHIATIEVEVVSGSPSIGTISRKIHTAIAHVVAAVAADRTLGIGLQSLEEIDVAPSGAAGRDKGSASIQFIAEFRTGRTDWFTIL